MYVVKTKALISYTVTAQVICAFIIPYAKTNFLTHLSRRLVGELIVYPWSGVCPSSLSTISNVFSSETTWPIKAKFNVEPHWVGGMKVC